MNHSLKIKPEYLENLISGIKKNEIRFNDRDYQACDSLIFNVYNPMHSAAKSIPSAQDIYFKITHIHSGLGMKEGFVCLSVVQLKELE